MVKGRLITGSVDALLGSIDGDDDDAGARYTGGSSLPPDPSRVVTNAGADPRGPSFNNQPVPAAGVQFLPVEGPPLAAPDPKTAIRQIKQASSPITEEDKALAAFLLDLGQDPNHFGVRTEAEVTITEDIPFVPAPDGSNTPYNRGPASTAASHGGGANPLEQAKKRAYGILAGLPPGCELYVGGGQGPEAIELAMGLGVLIGAGAAEYRGNGHYRLKLKGA